MAGGAGSRRPRLAFRACTTGLRRWLPIPFHVVAMAVAFAGSSACAQQRHADPALEALLPGTLGGVALMRESQRGTDLTRDSPAFDAFLVGLGRTRQDFVVASAYGGRGLGAEIGAWRVRGADSRSLLPAFKTAVQASSATPLTQAEETMARRSVARIGDPGQMARGPLYVVGIGDTLFFVQTSRRELAEEAMEKLPR